MSHARKEYKDLMALAPDAYEIVMALGKIAASAGTAVTVIPTNTDTAATTATPPRRNPNTATTPPRIRCPGTRHTHPERANPYPGKSQLKLRHIRPYFGYSDKWQTLSETR